MSPDPIIVQAAFAIPIAIGLVLYTLVRWDRMLLHVLLAGMLTSVVLWLSGTVLKLTAGPGWLQLVGLDLEISALIFMPPLFLITMGYFARSSLFEESHGPAFALLGVSSVFLVAYLTDDQHHLFFTDPARALSSDHPGTFAGPFFWAFQIWSGMCDAGALAYCASVLRRGRTSAERGRATMILAAVALPIVAHLAHLFEWLPIDYSLAPGTIALTAIFFVQGVHRYGLLGGQTIVRYDLIEHLHAGLILTDAQGVVADANRAAERLLAAGREQLRGEPLPAVLALLEPDRGDWDFGERIVELPLDGSRIDDAVHTTDGRTIELSGGGVPTLGSQPAGRFVSLDDRTAQRRSEQRLRETQKLESVGILAAGVAHEVNNPLAYVRANLVHLQSVTETLPEKLCDVDAARLDEMPEVIEESIEGLDRIARIVESMLRFTRTSDGDFGPVDLDDVVDQALRLASLKRDDSLRVVRRGGHLRSVRGNADRLVQVLLNLILNARQALADQDDAIIVAETRVEAEEVLVIVQDNGPGIPSALQQRIFDPFFTTRSPGSGTGLGLSIAFDIVRDHGGRLEMTSTPEDGTCFVVHLPAAPDPPPAVEADASAC